MASRRFHFEAEQWLPFPLPAVFAFFANPENLPRLMPSWQRARIDKASLVLPSPHPDGTHGSTGSAAGNGTRLTLTFRPVPLLPLRMSWDALIEDFRWEEGFCDVQTRGPFRYWRQCHRMKAAADPATGVPGTTLRDEIEYELPLPGALAEAANWIGGRPQIAALFAYRHRRTQELLAETEVGV